MAYAQLADLKEMVTGGLQHPKSVLMASLCCVALPTLLPWHTGGRDRRIGPERRKDLIALGPRAMIGGTLVSLISATLVGMLLV